MSRAIQTQAFAQVNPMIYRRMVRIVLAKMIATRRYVRTAQSSRTHLFQDPSDRETLRVRGPQIRLVLVYVLVCRVLGGAFGTECWEGPMSGSAQGAEFLFADARTPTTVVPIIVLVVRARSTCPVGQRVAWLG